MKLKLDITNLNKDLNLYVYTLSGGEQQRLALARLLLSDRGFIIADEPTPVIENRNYIISMLKFLNEKNSYFSDS